MSATATQSTFAPAPFESPLLGMFARTPPGANYAIYPLGRYTRAAFDDLPSGALTAGGRRFCGFIDDNAESTFYRHYPIASLQDAARNWDLDAIIITRDTHDGDLRRRVDAERRAGKLANVAIIDQPEPSLAAMLAHLATYSPNCSYEPDFVESCQSAHDSSSPTKPTLALTLDAEIFPYATQAEESDYAEVMHEFCRILADCGASATLCVQIEDSPGQMRATPPAVVNTFLDYFGTSNVALHGINHDMPSDGYPVSWIERGLSALHTQYGVEARYWAPPGWTLCWRTLRALRKTPIQYVRGMWTGVNLRQHEWPETFRAPYSIGHGLWQIPYCYVDWMFTDLQGHRSDWNAIMPAHKALASFAARGPCLIESVAHPFRMVGPDWRERLAIVRNTLELMISQGVIVQGVEQCLALQSTN